MNDASAKVMLDRARELLSCLGQRSRMYCQTKGELASWIAGTMHVVAPDFDLHGFYLRHFEVRGGIKGFNEPLMDDQTDAWALGCSIDALSFLMNK